MFICPNGVLSFDTDNDQAEIFYVRNKINNMQKEGKRNKVS